MAEPLIAPASSRLQRETTLKYAKEVPPVPANCVVTGGTGFVGLRLVEMLVERGAKRVVSFDVVPIDRLPENVQKNLWKHERIEYVEGDITNLEDVIKACKGADCVWHVAAAVGPYHPKEVYDKVNYKGTLNVIEACRVNKVPKMIMSSSPSTRMNGQNIDGDGEDELPSFEEMADPKGALSHASEGKWLQPYAASKFRGEKACREACCDDLLTMAVAPHQVYGPRDNLFLPNLLEAASSGKLRVFSRAETGYGMNKVCFTHVDNYAHGLIIAERALYPKSPALGKFYIVTDGSTHPQTEGYSHFWVELDRICVTLGYPSLWKKTKLPYWFMLIVGYACYYFSMLSGIKLKLNPFTVLMVTMHRWFRIQNAERDLNYKPIVAFEDGWKDTGEWFKEHWQAANKGMFDSIATQTHSKIDIQASSVNQN